MKLLLSATRLPVCPLYTSVPARSSGHPTRSSFVWIRSRLTSEAGCFLADVPGFQIGGEIVAGISSPVSHYLSRQFGLLLVAVCSVVPEVALAFRLPMCRSCESSQEQYQVEMQVPLLPFVDTFVLHLQVTVHVARNRKIST